MNRLFSMAVLFPLVTTSVLAAGPETHENQPTTGEQAAALTKIQQTAPSEEQITPELKDAAAKLAAQECALCHGRSGQSISPTFPRLAGQRAEYIEAQLKAFRDATRKDPDAQAYMWGMASQLTDPIIEALGHYYEQLKPVAPNPVDSRQVAAGKEIFERGIPAQNVPACQTCHMAQAQGAGLFPRLAGQHAAYLVKQMNSFKNGLRVNPVMQPIMQSFTSEQMEQVATYLESLP
jgi:cytochrome c553